MSNQNKLIARRIVEEVWNNQNYAAVDEHVARDFVGHSLEEIRGPEGYKRFFAGLHQAFPDMHFSIEDVLAEEDKVAMIWTAEGTHRGEFLGVPSTGKRVTTSGITMGRIANGKVIEGWTAADMLGLLQQLGAVPAPDRTG